MRISYYPETDTMYIDLASSISDESREVSPGIVIDYDKDKNIVGIDIDNASKKVDISELVLDRLPVKTQRTAL